MPKIKTYPHFDAELTLEKAELLATNPQAVASHAFHPFIEYSEGWTKYAVKNVKAERKDRSLKYASRRDSFIYSYYQGLLKNAYQSLLLKHNLDKCVLAYRSIPIETTPGNKNNIHFANDAFTKIIQIGNCTVYTLDISKFFDNLSHFRLKRLWIKLLSLDRLPPDHYAVFSNITRYSYVNRKDLYCALDFIGSGLRDGEPFYGFKRKRIPLQVCSSNIFRQKVVPLIQRNKRNCGIPQGSPISDVLANLYMLDFDIKMETEARRVGGAYFHYSDDILLIIPGINDEHSTWLKFVETSLEQITATLIIQPSKSTVHRFTSVAATSKLKCQHIFGKAGKNGLEYLGFRFDGSHIYLRDSTRSRLQRKMTYATKSAVRKLCNQNRHMGREELKKKFNINSVLKNFYKVRNFEPSLKASKWTFWTYVIRSRQIFCRNSNCIDYQLRNFKRAIKHKAGTIIDRHVATS